MGSGNPYREGGLASINPFAVGLFPTPAIQAQPSKDMYDSWTPEQKSEWDRYGEFGKRQPIDMPTPNVIPNPFAHYTDDTYPTGDETRPPVMLPQPIDMPRSPVMLPLPGQENPYPVGPIRPGGMPRPGRGRGFLNRFERLLDGLEGLVGKLGGESPKDTGPLVDPVGGVGSLTPTPFTASQDY